MISVQVDAKDLQRVIPQLQKLGKNMRKLVADAINEGLDKGRSQAAAGVSANYNVATPEIGVKKASAGDLTGYLKGEGGMKPVSEFSPSTTGGQFQTVSVSIIRGSRRSILPDSRGPGISGAFMLPDGRIMERRQMERYPIFPVSTIGIPQMLGSKKVSEPVREAMTQITMQKLTTEFLNSVK